MTLVEKYLIVLRIVTASHCRRRIGRMLINHRRQSGRVSTKNRS